MSVAPCKICGHNGPNFYQPKDHPCPGNPNFGNPETRDLLEHGWSFGTYPKTCSKCPPDNEFLGSKDSYLCYNHAVESRNSSIPVMNVNINRFTNNSPEPVFTNNVSVFKR